MPNSITLGTNYPWVKEIQISKVLFKGEIITKNGVGSFKNLLQNQLTNFNQTWHKSFLGEGDSNLFKRRGINLLQGEIIAKE
jgi:hypothetical protein